MRAFLFIPIFLPVGVDYRTRRLPVVTFTIMGLCAAVHLVSVMVWLNGGLDASRGFLMALGFIPQQPNWYSWLTHMFTHGGIMHLLGNMVYLFLFGSCVEDLLGRAKFAAFYLVGGVAALGVYVLMVPAPIEGHRLVPLVGASGAISACMGGFALVLHRTRITIKWIVLFFFRIFSGEWHLPAKLVMAFFFLSDVWGMVNSLDNRGGGVAFSAHVGGFLAGMGLMAVLMYGFGLVRLNDDEDARRPVRRPARAAAVPATIYLLADENQIGPFTRPQVLQMRELGSLEAGTLYWEDGMEEWRGIDEI